MSRRNIVNPDHYKIGGRLTPDEWARERRKQAAPLSSAPRRGRGGPVPPWLATPPAPPRAATGGKSGQGTEKSAAKAGRTAEERTKGTGTSRAARSGGATSRRAPKAPGARKAAGAPKATGTGKTASAPKARGPAARDASSRRAGRSSPRKTTSRGTGRKKSAKR